MSVQALRITAIRIAMLAIAAAAGLASGTARAGAQDSPDPRSEVAGLHSKFVDVNGVQARYYEAGSGEPMVMIHGGSTAGSSTANVFSRNIPGLVSRFHVFAVDRLASGMSGNPLKDDDYTVQGDVDFIYGFIQALKLGPVHLVGHSAGGAIAFYLAIEHPEIAKTLKLSGKVRIIARVAPSGKVVSTEVVGGHPILARAASDAVLQWRYEPAREQTEETAVITFEP